MDTVAPIKIEPVKDRENEERFQHPFPNSDGSHASRPVAVVTPQAENTHNESQDDHTEHYEGEEFLSNSYSDDHSQNRTIDQQNLDGQMPGSFRAFYPFPSEKGRMYFRSWRNLTHQRRLFSTEQLVGLKSAFENNAYPSRRQFEEIAESLKMKEKSVRLWFQNRRARLRKSGNVQEAEMTRSSVRVRDNIPKLPRGNPSSLPVNQVAALNTPFAPPPASQNMFTGSSSDNSGPEMGEITPAMRKHLNHLRELAKCQPSNSNLDSDNEDSKSGIKADVEMERRRESYRKRMQSNPYFKYYTNLSGIRSNQPSPYVNTERSSPHSLNSENSNSPASMQSQNSNSLASIQSPPPHQTTEEDQPLDLSTKKSCNNSDAAKRGPLWASQPERDSVNSDPGSMGYPLMMPFVPPWMFPMATHPSFSGFPIPPIPASALGRLKTVKETK